MPNNTGRKPPYEYVDLRLRNGIIIRNVKSDGWRWRQWPEGEHQFDIVQYQPSTEGKK